MINDLKYEIKDGKLVNKVSGEEVPENEPIFILRARDILAYATINYYVHSCVIHKCKASHIKAGQENIRRFMEFSIHNIERMKRPGETESIKIDKGELK